MSLTRERRTEGEQGPTEAEEQSDRTLDRDLVFTLLKNERRRAVLSFLADRPETTLSDLADRIAAAENDTTPDQLSSSERKRVYISLYQNHLPKLADAEVIEYDQSRGDVRRLESAERLQGYLDRLDSDTAESGVGTVHVAGCVVAVLSLVGTLVTPGLGAVWALVAGATLLTVTLYEQVDGVDSPPAARLRAVVERVSTRFRADTDGSSPRSRSRNR